MYPLYMGFIAYIEMIMELETLYIEVYPPSQGLIGGIWVTPIPISGRGVYEFCD
jgi:hypothetical protein